MTRPDPEYFIKIRCSAAQIAGYLKRAQHDLEIAKKDAFVEVRFTYAYQALVKIGIALLAKEGLRVRAVPGHHAKILGSAGRILKDPDIAVFGNAMRMKRNEDLYGTGEFVSEKETAEYVDFVRSVLDRAERRV